MPNFEEYEYLSGRGLAEFLGINEFDLHEIISRPDFPKSEIFNLYNNSFNIWKRSEIDAYLESTRKTEE